MNVALPTGHSAPPSTDLRRAVDWLAVATFGFLWLEVIWRLRFEWSINPQYGYGWTVPFLAAYIFWRRYEAAPARSPARVRFPAIGIMLVGAAALIPVRLIQEANPDWRMLSWMMASSVAITTAAGVYLAGGRSWLRHFAFPILFFMVAVPWPTQLEQVVIQGLMRADALINVEFLNAIGIPAVQLGNVIEVGSGFVGIDEACTGIRSLQATLMVSLFLGEFYDFTIFRRVILVVAGAVLAFVCNLVRTFLLVWLGAEHGSQTIKSWHDPAGFTILTACLLGLWCLSMFLRGKEDLSRLHVPPSHPGSRVSRIVLLAVFALAVSAEAATQFWYRSHESDSARLQAWTVAWPSAAPGWKDVPVAENAQELLRYNEGGGGTWSGEDGHNFTMYFFRWLPGRTAGLFIKNHRPDVCLPASGMTLRGDVRHRLFTVNGIGLPIRSYVFEHGGRLLHVYYCYWDGTPPAARTVDQEDWTAAGRLEAVRRGKRDVGTQMLELVAWGYENDDRAEEAAKEQLARIIHPRA